MKRHEVVLILEPQFDGDLWELSRVAHVWIVDSAQNTAAARSVWDRKPDYEWPTQGLTTFRQYGDATASLYRTLGTVDEHHGEHAAAVPWQAIHVRGVAIDDVSAPRIAEELGSVSIHLLPENAGFAIVRAAQPADVPQTSRG